MTRLIAAVLTAVVSWQCEWCGHHNPPQHSTCRRCRAS